MADSKAISKGNQSSSGQVSFRTWVGIFATMLGAFMAVLDIQITNSSLQQIQASLGATLDEGSWISTAYLVAEIVVIPLTGWLSRVFSLKRYLLVNTALFIVFSALCATAQNLPTMILFRACQGFTGGILIPTSFSVILTTLPPAKQSIGLAAFGITAVFAPSIGPTLGGWLTENLGWQYNFYINIFPGVLMLAGAWYGIKATKPQYELLKQGDWWGIIAMAIGLSSIEVVLEEGERKDWFGSTLITQLAIIGVTFFILFLIRELTAKRPFISLGVLLNRNFGLASIVNVSLGVGLYGSIYILPLYLAQIQGYNAQQIGEVLVWAGVPQLFIIPFLPKIMQRVDVRFLVGLGVSLFGISAFMNSDMTHLTGYDQLRYSQLVRAMGQPLIIVPLSSIATAGLSPQVAGSASGLFNMMRNLGGSIGIASLSTLLTKREEFHSNRIGDAISLYSPQTQQRITNLTNYFISRGTDPDTAHNQAIKSIYNIVRRESYVMAFNDCFYFIGIALLLSGLAIIFIKKVKPSGGAVAH